MSSREETVMTAGPAGGCHPEVKAVPSVQSVDFSGAPSIAIRVEDLWKQYRLGTLSHATLRQDLQSWWARLLGRDDPNARIASSGDATPVGARFWALQGATFEVRQGEVLGIIGRNGAGKSTLLKILSRVTAPSRGEIKIRGRVASLLEVGTGFHPELTGRENIFLNGAILGMSREEIRGKLDEIIAFSEIERFIDTPVKRYSSGMYVRLAFAVAAHLEPEILVVDEVLAVGDAAFQKKCLGKMEAVGKEGRTVLFVSHNMNAVNRLCQRALLLSNGVVEECGPTSDIVARYLDRTFGRLNNEVEVADDPAKPSQVLRLQVQNLDGKSAATFETTEPVVVAVDYKNATGLPGGYGVVLIRNQQGEIVFLSDSRDSSHSSNVTSSGRFRVKLQFPAPLLTPGKYTVTASIARSPTGTIDMLPDAVTFEVVDSTGQRATRAGSIYVPLPWRRS